MQTGLPFATYQTHINQRPYPITGQRESITMSANPSTIIFGLYGAGGFAREVMPLVREYVATCQLANPQNTYDVYFVETHPKESQVNGCPIISEAEFFAKDCTERLFNIAIGDSKIRERIANNCIAKGAKPMSLQSTHAVHYDYNEIGEGALICANTMVTSNVKIGKFFHSNIYAYVAHDCVIGDYVTFAPRVHCNGNIHIHDHAYIGTGAVIKQGTPSKPLVIGEGAIVGMGAVVTKDVPPHTTVVGNPARRFNKA